MVSHFKFIDQFVLRTLVLMGSQYTQLTGLIGAPIITLISLPVLGAYRLTILARHCYKRSPERSLYGSRGCSHRLRRCDEMLEQDDPLLTQDTQMKSCQINWNRGEACDARPGRCEPRNYPRKSGNLSFLNSIAEISIPLSNFSTPLEYKVP